MFSSNVVFVHDSMPSSPTPAFAIPKRCSNNAVLSHAVLSTPHVLLILVTIIFAGSVHSVPLLCVVVSPFAISLQRMFLGRNRSSPMYDGYCARPVAVTGRKSRSTWLLLRIRPSSLDMSSTKVVVALFEKLPVLRCFCVSMTKRTLPFARTVGVMFWTNYISLSRAATQPSFSNISSTTSL